MANAPISAVLDKKKLDIRFKLESNRGIESFPAEPLEKRREET
jgi:hypothetical protein